MRLLTEYYTLALAGSSVNRPVTVYLYNPAKQAVSLADAYLKGLSYTFHKYSPAEVPIKDEVTDAGNTVLYFGCYIPELMRLDLRNANTANQYGLELVGRTAELEAEPVMPQPRGALPCA